ncbi:hypothetical protein [Tsukamurella pseudospumae]|uniref:Haloacid dehalogenase n=1 Tax=Tsukamurella pseudospumae TaxID=239498 RepID=A0A137Z7T6_9ACTN|nr:hypothetical protein [Tsukamurella pseudospumae]KXO94247.1 hypothetical protein AXK61_23960 [Tsukamurella pseudospumae]
MIESERSVYIIDLDGTIYSSEVPIVEVIGIVNRLPASDTYYLSNNDVADQRTIAAKLQSMGVCDVAVANIRTALDLAPAWIAAQYGHESKIYTPGNEQLAEHLASAGFEVTAQSDHRWPVSDGICVLNSRTENAGTIAVSYRREYPDSVPLGLALTHIDTVLSRGGHYIPGLGQAVIGAGLDPATLPHIGKPSTYGALTLGIDPSRHRITVVGDADITDGQLGRV